MVRVRVRWFAFYCLGNVRSFSQSCSSFLRTEAARGGSTEAIKYLVEEHGVDINERTHFGSGASPLYYAERTLEEDHEVIVFLREHGARVIAPGA